MLLVEMSKREPDISEIEMEMLKWASFSFTYTVQLWSPQIESQQEVPYPRQYRLLNYRNCRKGVSQPTYNVKINRQRNTTVIFSSR